MFDFTERYYIFYVKLYCDILSLNDADRPASYFKFTSLIVHTDIFLSNMAFIEKKVIIRKFQYLTNSLEMIKYTSLCLLHPYLKDSTSIPYMVIPELQSLS